MYRVICPVCKTGFEAKLTRENCAINCVSCSVAFNAAHYLPKPEKPRGSSVPPPTPFPQRYTGPVLIDPPRFDVKPLHSCDSTHSGVLPFSDSFDVGGGTATLEPPRPRKAAPEPTPLPQISKPSRPAKPATPQPPIVLASGATVSAPSAASSTPPPPPTEPAIAVASEYAAIKPGPVLINGPVLKQGPVISEGPVLKDMPVEVSAPTPLIKLQEIARTQNREPARRGSRRPLLEGTFGKYDIESEIARGGVGAVFRARERGTGKPFALKVLLEGEEAGETERERFRHECETAKALSLPGMVQVHEVGDCDGRPFMAMELVEGKSLDKVIAERSLGVDECLVLMKSVAETVGALHDAGYVHRDLKPGNILLDAFGSPKVADFGLVKSLDEVTRMTASGLVCGTPAYMSPEQARGEGRNVDPRSDVWALGAVLYEMLASEPPFKADNALKLMLRITKEQPRKLTMVNRKVPSGVESIVMKCLDKKPVLRYANGRELAADIAAFRDGRKLKSDPQPRMSRILDRAYENRAKIIPAAAACAAIVLIAFVTKITMSKQDAAPSVERGFQALSDAALTPAEKLNRAERSFREALLLDKDNARAYMGLGLVLARRGIDPAKHVPVNPSLVREAFKLNERAAQLDPKLQGEALANAARYNMWLNDHVAEANNYERAVQAAPSNLKYRESLGLAYWNAGAQTRSPKYYQAAVNTFESILAVDRNYPKVGDYIRQIYDKFLAQGRSSAMAN